MALPITGLGLVSALAYGAAGTCAAVRAGVSLPREVSTELGPVTCYPAREVAGGFFQTGAWVRLAAAAIEDARYRGDWPAEATAEFWRRSATVGAVPLLVRERFLWDLASAPHGPRRFFLEPLARVVRGLAVGGGRFNAAGHVALAAALQQVQRGFATREADRFVVAAADSLVDEWCLLALAAAHRLKDADHPTGLMPGEAGAALLLETDQAARLRKAEVLGYIEAVAVGDPVPPRPPPGDRPAPGAPDAPDARSGEDEPEDDEGWLPPFAPSLGRAIAATVRKVLPAPAAPGARWRGDLYLDLNGEHWRAEAWGHACVHLLRHVDLDACRVSLPAESLGDTGAASAPLALALALWNFDRDRTRDAVVVSVADHGATGAIRLSGPCR